MYAIFPWQKLTGSTQIQDDHLQIPKEQKAAIFNEHGEQIQLITLPVPSIENDELLVCICYSGVCKMDFQTWQGTLPWRTRELPLIGGHKAVGMVVKISSNVTNFKIGDCVGIKWINGTCMICDFCKSGQEPNCPGVILTGCSRNGTFCQYTTVKEMDAVSIPKHVDMPMATAILCEGLMIYRALKETKVRPGQTVAIAGAGGSIGKLAIQFACAMGMRVLALDQAQKEDKCRMFGAEFFVDASDEEKMFAEIVRLTDGGPHGALSCAPNLSCTEQITAVEYVRPHGRVVLTGMPTDNFTINSASLVLRCVQVVGSYVGNRLDTDEAMDFFARGLVNGQTEIVPLNELANVYERLRKGNVSKHLVLDLQDCE